MTRATSDWDMPSLGLAPTPGQREQLDSYVDLLKQVALPRGMVARSEENVLADRHVKDSARAVSLLRPEERTVIDLGSGAGLPGLPMAIMAPEVRFTLVESRRNRVAFLELVIDSLKLLNVRVFAGWEDDLEEKAQVCVARAFASPRDTWEAAEKHLEPQGRLIYWAGSGFHPSDLEGVARVEVATTSTFATSGPLVIISAL